MACTFQKTEINIGKFKPFQFQRCISRTQKKYKYFNFSPWEGSKEITVYCSFELYTTVKITIILFRTQKEIFKCFTYFFQAGVQFVLWCLFPVISIQKLWQQPIKKSILKYFSIHVPLGFLLLLGEHKVIFFFILKPKMGPRNGKIIWAMYAE